MADPNVWRQNANRENFIRTIQQHLHSNHIDFPIAKISEVEAKMFAECTSQDEYKKKLAGYVTHIKTTYAAKRNQQAQQQQQNMVGASMVPGQTPIQRQHAPMINMQQSQYSNMNVMQPQYSGGAPPQDHQISQMHQQQQQNRMQHPVPPPGAPGYGPTRAPYSPASSIATPSPANIRMSQGPSPQMMTPNPPSSMMSGSEASPTPSSVAPSSVMDEEQMYMEKLKELSIYIEPVKKMIPRPSKDASQPEQVNGNKMAMLLNILQANTSQRVSYENLLKCEELLKKNVKLNVSQAPVPTAPTAPTSHWCQPLLTAVAETVKSSQCKNVLQNTFSATVHTLYGPKITINNCLRGKKRKIEDSDDQETTRSKPHNPPVSHLVQGEIARLSRCFKVSRDKLAQYKHLGDQALHITIDIVDKNLPEVPSLKLSLPSDYPNSSPVIDENCMDVYNNSEFLSAVKKRFENCLIRLKNKHCLTILLDTWVASVKQVMLQQKNDLGMK